MGTCATALILLFAMSTTTTFCLQEIEILQMAQTHVSQAKTWVGNSIRLHGLGSLSLSLDHQTSDDVVALRNCAKLYEESESRLSHMVYGKSSYTKEDALSWVSAVMTNHRTCLDGLNEKGHVQAHHILGTRNLTMLLGQALALYSKNKSKDKGKFFYCNF